MPVAVCPTRTQNHTVQAIAIAAAFRDEWPCLVIAPSSLRGAPQQVPPFASAQPALESCPIAAVEAWADALHRWLGITEDKMKVIRSNKDLVPTAGVDWVVVSYSMIQRKSTELTAKRFSVVIVDESHCIKVCWRRHAPDRSKALHAARMLLRCGRL